MSEVRSVRLLVEGRVQGVGYRAWLAATAERAGLAGWTRNQLDGSVAALLSGPREAVDAVIQGCWRGPALARVEQVTVTPVEAPGEAGFRVLPTA